MAVSARNRLIAFRKTEDCCGYCGVKFDFNDYNNMCLDHIIAKSKGGSDLHENLMPSCRSCNSAKGIKNIEEFRKHKWFKGILPSLQLTPIQIDELLDSGLFHPKSSPSGIIFNFEKGIK